MFDFWHNVVGRYNPQDRWVGLDYSKLLHDPLHAELTYFHEFTHGILMKSTEFGQATEFIYQVLPYFKKMNQDDQERLAFLLRENQLIVQETTASLMEVLHLSQKKNKRIALKWAEENMSPEYYERFERVSFVLNMSKRYSEEFTKKIPYLAMQTDIRKIVSEEDLFSNLTSFEEYLKIEDNNPNMRFIKMIDKIRCAPYLVTKDHGTICSICKVKFHQEVLKSEIACFLNYVSSISGDNNNQFSEANVSDSLVMEELFADLNDRVIVADMNMGSSKKSEILWKMDDFIFYEDEFEAVMVALLPDKMQGKKEIEGLTGRKCEVLISGFTGKGFRYTISCDIAAAENLLINNLVDKTLIVKWGLYNSGEKHLLSMPKSRKPDVVIFNNIAGMRNNFANYFQSGANVECLHMGSTDNHPIQTLMLRDVDGVLYMVNTFGNAHIDKFKREYKTNIISSEPSEFVSHARHFNNAFSLWMGLSWEINWYDTMITQNLIMRR